MAVRNIAGKDIDFDAEGYLADRAVWTEDIARALGSEEGIDPLTERHWIVINFMRREFEAKGDAPSIRKLTKESGVETKELYQLFPKGPAKIAARVAGLPKPKGCI
jgi:dissimilatory sulfite reductase related protein